MLIEELINRLQNILTRSGKNVTARIMIETKDGQIERPLKDLAYSPASDQVILISED